MMYQGVYSERCWLDGRLQPATIMFSNGIISDIVSGRQSAIPHILHAGKAVVMPGVIDAHVHINEPGRTEWEGFETATAAAAAGGTTTIVDMPLNANPVTTTANALQQKLSASENKLHVNVGFYGGVVPDNKNEIEGLIEGGVLGLKAFLTHSGIDEFPNVLQEDLEAVMPVIAEFDIPLLVHCELSDDDFQDALIKDPASYKAYLASRPKEWENDAVSMMINLCRKYNCKTHIVHVSSADALPLIKSAKEEGLPLTAETCAHYILFHAEMIQDGQTIFKCAPPIRDQQNNEKLKQALADGILDFITTDHSPAPPALKEITSGDFKKAWGGIAGVQFLLSASWTAMKDRLAIEQFIPLITEAPARFLNIHLQKGYLQTGFDADITIWSPEESFAVQEANILHRHKITPYAGQQLAGVVQHTFVNGHLVYSNQNIIQKNKGKWLLRK